ncbi:permease-like cell division protein FtsX [Actinoplanes couchii]|uniref:FtsX extracellular domain-containing protein n=1 Tax=Actinoplanes couchii TaxID=403638 RepID=A0ABQ3XJK7_9ACTN|nr:permease-like cell division protein FtsX [Actinoplanes couchii]MDR6324178.1 cell division protein FtsX [Actinoplanes couchii]GID58683.1 hypothetical protein Aco03nite_070870 [Actinoplanes couchii]
MSDPHPTDNVSSAPRWLRLFAVAAGAVVLGSLASTTAMLLAGWRYAPERQFSVAVYLEPDAGTDQREAVQDALGGLPEGTGVRLETREEAYARFRERVANDPDQLAGVDAGSMPESLHLITNGRSFDCDPIPGIRKLSGVDRVRVVMKPLAGRWGAEVAC